MSRFGEQMRSTKSRPYAMRRRAELVDRTRQRIVEATVRLHTSVGPANTTIAGIAAEADVTRLTVYRHFPDIDELFLACRVHWQATHPPPDYRPWRAIERLADRAARAFADLYGWYADNGADLFPIYRDLSAMPAANQAAVRAQADTLADALVGDLAPGGRSRPLWSVARHLVAFWTWHSLTHDEGLSTRGAEKLAAALLVAAASEGVDSSLPP